VQGLPEEGSALAAEPGSVIFDNPAQLLEGIVFVLPYWATPRNKGRPADDASFPHYSGCGEVISKPPSSDDYSGGIFFVIVIAN
jgi:hypothetical protein